MITRVLLAAILAYGGTLGSIAAELPKEGKLDNRIRFVDYDPHQVTQIVSALFVSTQIEFGADETVIHASIGDPVWEIAPSENFVFVKVREVHKSTNLQVVTERPDRTTRSYQIELGVMPPALAAKNPPFFLIKYRYPGDEANRRKQAEAAVAAERRAGEVDATLARDEKNGPRNWAYSIQGETSFEPAEIFDNGKITTLKFPGTIEMPAIFAVGEDGKEELVPKSVNGDAVFVHMVAKKLVLRRGDAVMCVFNEAFVPGGIDPGTRTTSPSVARVAAAGTGSKRPTNISRSSPEPSPALGGVPTSIDPSIFKK